MWVNIKRFGIESDGSDEELIATLIADRQYRDHYAGQDPIEQNQDDLHGPYWLSAIDAGSFVAIHAQAAMNVIQSWADDPERQSEEVQRRLRDEVYPLLGCGCLYRLPDLRPTAEHEWGWVVGHEGFHEFVAVDRPAAQVALIVASDD
jgi:hypothetical protein